MTSESHKDKLWNLIKDIKVGMLCTQDSEFPRARPMHVVQKNYDGKLWFYTNKHQEKVNEIVQDNKVCITFCDPNEDVYVSLSGIARLTMDQELIDKFWSPFVAAWFPKGKDGGNVALIELDVVEGEHWNSNENKVVQLFKTAKANLTGQMPDIGENQKFG